MEAKIIKNHKDGWVDGVVGDYMFQAKVYKNGGSGYGINDGRVSKLVIWDENIKGCFSDKYVIAYDREWIVMPKPENQEYFNAVMMLLENN